MKTSSGLLLGVLFTLVVVIVALVIYFNTRPEEEEKPETLDGPTLPGISDLTVSRKDSPDSGSESYTIEPYTIEYDEGEEEATAYLEGDNEKALSKNITFTLNWTNNDGFDNVTGIKIEHHIDTATDGSLEKKRTIEDESITLRSNFTDVSYSITGDGEYSFVGKNRFKIIAVLDRKLKSTDANNQEYVLYDGLEDESGNILSINGLDIKSEDLTATIGMALPLEKTFELELRDGSYTGANKATKKITNKKYTFKAVPYKKDPPSKEVDESKRVVYNNIELIAQDDAGKKFKFRSGDGKYWAIGAGGGGNSKDTSVAPADKVYGYYTLKTDEIDPNKAAIIIFAKSSKPRDPGMERDYNSLKIVMGTATAPIDMYLHGIDDNVTFRPLDDTLVSTSYKLSNTRHWKIT
tara:strand:- start:559 stop:1782 length:1224 start_codon:yes stop_codon:yes gene_type:complete